MYSMARLLTMPNHATALAIILLAIFSVFPVQTVQSAVSADIDGSDLDFAQHAQHGRGRNHGRLHRDNLHDDIADLPSSNQSMLMRRDDYSCGPGNPCSNGACCGVSGYCGYGKWTQKTSTATFDCDSSFCQATRIAVKGAARTVAPRQSAARMQYLLGRNAR